eukprot:m.127183 g.127183  ORF g.127183 m.127183 type:complete len:452 (-) comp13850_c3_seq1:690-2045(-)
MAAVEAQTAATEACVRELLCNLLPVNMPAKVPPSEPNEVKMAYKAGLKVVHQQSGGQVCEYLGVDPTYGLPVAAALTRLDKYGPNKGCSGEAILYGCESWAEQRFSREYTVVRGGDVTSANTEAIVVGDIVYLQEGDVAPADLRILRASTVTKDTMSFQIGKGWVPQATEVATVLDASIPSHLGPMPVESGACQSKLLPSANNVALRGSSVVSGQLVGVVFATGARCVIADLKKGEFFRESQERLPRGIDKKKLAKVCEKVLTLGLSIRNLDHVVPLCGNRKLAVVLSISGDQLVEAQQCIKQLVGLAYNLIVYIKYDVDPARDLKQLPNAAVGTPINLDHVDLLNNQQAVEDSVTRMKSESVVLATGPDDMFDAIVRQVKAAFTDRPVVALSTNLMHQVGLEHANLGITLYTAHPALLSTSTAIAGPNGLSRLALFLKVLQESTEIGVGN